MPESTPETRAAILAKVAQRWDPYARQLAEAAREDETRAWRYMKQESEARRASIRARGLEPQQDNGIAVCRPSPRLMKKARQRPNYGTGTGPPTTRAEFDELTGGHRLQRSRFDEHVKGW